MRIAIFGTGGAGGYFGAMLARSGADVTFIARGAHLEAIREKGLLVATPKGDFLIEHAAATDDPAGVGAVDVVILGVKTWQVPEAAQAMRPMIGESTVVVPLQNGVDAPSQLASVLGERHVLGGLCATLSWVDGPGRIRTIGGSNYVAFGTFDGRPSEAAEQLRLAFDRAGVNVEVPSDIRAALWKKLLFVTSMGGVGSLKRAPIGVLRATAESRRMLVRCMEEVHGVARAKGIALPDDVVASSMALIDSLPESGTTSLQRDITEGKPSELEAWNGAVARLAREALVGAPTHRFIYESLLPLEMQARRAVTSTDRPHERSS